MALTPGQETPILSLLKACANSGPRNEPSALGWVIIYRGLGGKRRLWGVKA